jgi:hypothetical protein
MLQGEAQVCDVLAITLRKMVDRLVKTNHKVEQAGGR